MKEKATADVAAKHEPEKSTADKGQGKRPAEGSPKRNQLCMNMSGVARSCYRGNSCLFKASNGPDRPTSLYKEKASK